MMSHRMWNGGPVPIRGNMSLDDLLLNRGLGDSALTFPDSHPIRADITFVFSSETSL